MIVLIFLEISPADAIISAVPGFASDETVNTPVFESMLTPDGAFPSEYLTEYPSAANWSQRPANCATTRLS